MDKLVTITLLYWTIFIGASVRCQEPTQPPLQSDVEIESERGQCEKNSSQCAVREDGVILIAGTGWWPRTGDLSWNIIQKDISTLLKKTGHSVYITVFDATEEEIRDARNHGIDLIIAAEVSEDMPYSDRLLRHQVYFPILKEFKNISVIIGYADDESLSDAALSMQDSYFQDASFVLFLTHIPEDTDKEALVIENHANNILEHAQSAKFLISIGPRIYSHFRNKFRTITKTDFTPEHLQFIPGVDDKILNTGVSCPFVEGKIEILSFDFAAKSVSDCTKNSEIAALAIGKLANDTVAMNRLVNRFEWKIRGLPQKIARECQDLLRIKTDSPHVSVKAYPFSGDVIEKISNDFKQCHLHLFTPEQDPFGMITLMSSAAGVPTVITTHSGVAEYLKQDMMEQYNMIVVGGFGIHDDPAKIAGRLKEKVAHFLGNQNSYETFFENAKTLQNILTMSMREGFIDDSHKNLSTKFKEEVHAKLQERRFSKDSNIPEGEHVNKSGTANRTDDISLTEMDDSNRRREKRQTKVCWCRKPKAENNYRKMALPPMQVGT
ncbi:uncharacterized protein [Ptychodera flava]|uniref:uncharacterized protein isoform X2 n=1 Tax=Ptychodera flava TaxID=63121 RepID=UPI00396A4E7C